MGGEDKAKVLIYVYFLKKEKKKPYRNLATPLASRELVSELAGTQEGRCGL